MLNESTLVGIEYYKHDYFMKDMGQWRHDCSPLCDLGTIVGPSKAVLQAADWIASFKTAEFNRYIHGPTLKRTSYRLGAT